MRPTRRAQPLRKTGSRPPSQALSAAKKGRTAGGYNPQDMHRLATKKANQRRRRRLQR